MLQTQKNNLAKDVFSKWHTEKKLHQKPVSQ